MDSLAQMACIAHAIATVGTAAFPTAINAVLQTAFTFDGLFVSVFAQDRAPVPLYSDLTADETRRSIAPYLSHAYRLDPFYGLFAADVGTTVVSLDECAPDDFRHSDYYRMFYSDTGLRDEVSIFLASKTGTSIVLSLGRRVACPQRDSDACLRLQTLLPVIAVLCHQHWPNPANLAPSALPLAAVFDGADRPKLSAREAEVVGLMLKGHSTKSMARLMGNSPETVKVHRKRIYSKLGISSQGQMFSRFLGSVSGGHGGQYGAA